MSYFEEIDSWLTSILIATEEDQDEEEWFLRVKKQIKGKILESYRNGQKAGLEPNKPIKQARQSEAKASRFWPRRGREGRQ